MNSFRFLERGVNAEIARQRALLEAGGEVSQETLHFDPASGALSSLRSKEEAHDYRYFPEPDLAPLRASEAWVAEVRATMPELPAAKRKRFVDEYGLRESDAQVLTATRAMSDYYEKVAEASGDPKTAANWVMGDLLGSLKGGDIEASPVSAAQLGELVALIKKGEISGKLAKEIFPKMFSTGESAAVIMDREGLRQINDSGALEKIIDDVLAGNPKQVEQYRAGKTAVMGFLVGQVMKASRGQASPGAVNDLLKQKLS
jgi:aspartyl-tRNA(Asn)/glutamyl-tRNA(Gln) amidotransferase subunit B